MPWLQDGFLAALLASSLRLATPVLVAALGELLVERAGIINLGIEGMMALGAFAGVYGASQAGAASGLALGALAGAALALVMGLAVLRGGVNQFVAGIAVALLGSGLADYLFQIWQPSGRSAVIVPLVPALAVPGLDRLPVIGAALFAQSPLTYAALLGVPAMAMALRTTRPGLALRAAGDDPVAAGLRGIAVGRLRLLALMAAGALAGLAGATMTIGYLGSFSDGITAGRGYVAIAVVIIGQWRPGFMLLGALLFALFDALALLAQGGTGGLPVELYAALPYAVTLVALVATARGRHAPRALGVPLE